MQTPSQLLTATVGLFCFGLGNLVASDSDPQTVVNPVVAHNSIIAEGTIQRPPELSTPNRARTISPAMAEKISLKAPKFIPPKPEDVSAAATDLRETDKPKNQIVRLPDYLVKEPKSPVLKESDVMTQSAKLALSLKRHPGLRLGSFWIFNNNGIALAMLEEEERLKRKAEMTDLADLYRYTDPPKGASLRRDVEHTFMRTSSP